MRKYRTRISVLKRMCNEELGVLRASGSVSPCGAFEDGHTFIVDRWDEAPEGFCHWAWSDIHKEIMLVMGGGNNPGMRDEGTVVACCSDGFKPVVFKIERLE